MHTNMTRTTRAASANLANSMMAHTLGINGENIDNIATTKVSLIQPRTMHISRNALGDIGNKVSAIKISDGTKKGPIKKEIIHLPSPKQISRNKGTLSLQSLAEGGQIASKEQKAFLFREPIVPPLLKVEPVINFPKALAVPPATVHQQPNVPAPMDISENGPEAFSKALFNIQDIDINDKDNPQLVCEYVNDIYDYMRVMENKYPVKANYLEGREITGKMRAILIDWLCQVHHRFHLLQETLFLTVAIIDRFLQEYPVNRNQLQLVGVTSMLIAAKYEEMYAPEVNDFVYITDNAYTKKEIIEMEQHVLRGLQFSFGRPLALHFLRRNSKAGQVDATKHTLAKYLLELTITEYDMVQYLPSEIGAAALCLSMKLLDNSRWTDTLSYYSSYSEAELFPTMQKLASLVVKAEKSKLTAIRTKYSSTKFTKISTLEVLKSAIIKDLAAACT